MPANQFTHEVVLRQKVLRVAVQTREMKAEIPPRGGSGGLLLLCSDTTVFGGYLIHVLIAHANMCETEHTATGRRTTHRRRSCTATRFTRQQMIDMGLVPPEGTAEEEGQANQDSPSLDDEGVEENGGGCANGDAAEEPAEAIGLIGHFEAAHLVAHKGREGSFVGSLDMSMTERDLASTEDGVGECVLRGASLACCRLCLSVTAHDNQP